MEDTATIFITMMRELADKIDNHRKEAAARLDELRNQTTEQNLRIVQVLAGVQTDVRSLVGNGQPGRIGNIEEDVKGLLQFRYTVLGYASAISSITALIGWFFRHA